MADQKSTGLDEHISVVNFWDKRGLDEVAFREYDEEDVSYLMRQMPYLQLVCIKDEGYQPKADDVLDDGTAGTPALVSARTGWVMQYWPPLPKLAAAISSSPGSQVLSYSDLGEPVNFKMHYITGSLSKQAFTTAADMVALAVQQGWPGIHIVAGDRHMQWAAWALAEANGLKVLGFDPSKADSARAKRAAHCMDISHLTPSALAKAGPGMGLGGHLSEDGKTFTSPDGFKYDAQGSSGMSEVDPELTDEALFGKKIDTKEKKEA